jgi:GT2 family glycosyltransferase
MRRLGIVVIGRNEGERLERCLASCRGADARVVYVDSGSTDGSVAAARAAGAEVVELDLARPFTMARGRNAGFHRLLELEPELPFVQFVDGDCELERGWLARAEQELLADPGLVVVCGRRRERFPERSRYNRLADMEWNTPVGPARYCGGDAMMRCAAVRAVGGYDESLIAGEEPDLCVRLRRAGGRIQRVDAPMTIHDAAMTRFSQWWRRTIRNGFAYADGAARHGAPPERHWVKPTRSALLWGIGGPCGALATAPFLGAATLLWIFPYLLLGWRVRRWRRSALRDPPGAATLYATFCVLAKLPEAIGVLRFHALRLRGRRATLIEYKDPPPRSGVQGKP